MVHARRGGNGEAVIVGIKMRKKMKKGFVILKIDQIVKAAWNYKSDDKEMLEKLVRNIHENGLIQNLIVRELETGAYECVNGNHRLDALNALKYDDVMVFNLGKVTDAKAKRIAIETNEVSFDNDMLRLADTLRDITKEFDVESMLQTLPYSEKQLNKLLQLNNWATVKEGEKKDSEDTILLKIPMTFEQIEQWNEFKAIIGTDNDTSALVKAVAAFMESK